MNPWDILGLPRGTTDRSAIRRAYAAGIKVHRPDDDPGGFRRIRDAYELLSKMDEATLASFAADARGESLGEPSEVAVEDSRSAVLEAAVAPRDSAREGEEDPRRADADAGERGSAPALDPDWRALLDAAAALPEGPARDEAVVDALRRITNEALGDAEVRPRWEEIVGAAAERRPDLVSRAVGPAAFASALAAGAVTVPLRLLGIWVERADWDAALAATRAVIGASPPISAPAAALPLARLAALIAIFAPKTARSLGDQAFRLAPVEARRELGTEFVDGLARVGDEAANWTPYARRFLAKVVHGGGWDGKSTPAGLQDLLRGVAKAGRDSAVAALLRSCAPQVLGRVRFPPTEEPLGERIVKRGGGRRPHAAKSGGLGGYGWAIAVALVAVLRLGGLFTRNPAPSPPTFTMPDFRFDRKPPRADPEIEREWKRLASRSSLDERQWKDLEALEARVRRGEKLTVVERDRLEWLRKQKWALPKGEPEEPDDAATPTGR